MGKLEWCRYPMVKKFRRYLYSFWRKKTPERDRQTDGHRVTAKTTLMHMHRAVKCRQQLDRCLAATLLAARHHSNAARGESDWCIIIMHQSLSPLAA